MLIPIPCVVMRGGTSKGPFFLQSDLPQDEARRNQVLLAVMGSPDRRQIDGLGGGDSLSSKVVMVSASSRPGIDVEYLFAQVSVDSATVDTSPNCGNMLAGVAPFALEHGLVAAEKPHTAVRIYNQNTGKVVEAIVQTPGGKVNYEGEVHIDGVPGSGAPILLNFMDAAGAKTGKLMPTGQAIDIIDGVEVSCWANAVTKARPSWTPTARCWPVSKRCAALPHSAWGWAMSAIKYCPRWYCCRRRRRAARSARATSCHGTATLRMRSPAPSAWPPPATSPARWHTAWPGWTRLRRSTSPSSTPAANCIPR